MLQNLNFQFWFLIVCYQLDHMQLKVNMTLTPWSVYFSWNTFQTAFL